MVDVAIRVGIVGAGSNTRAKHIPGLQVIEGVEIVGVCNRSVESSRRVADEFGIPRVYGHWRDVVDDPDVNAVVIGTWPNMHSWVTTASFGAGKHVMCEARMAASASEAHAMLESSRRRPDLVAQVVPSPFTLGVDATICRLIAEGFLGEVLALEVRASSGFADVEGPMHWRHDADLSGVNTMSLGIWYEAVMRWLGEATSVQAMGKTCVPMRKDAEGRMRAVRVADHIDVTAAMACGAQMHMQISAVAGLAGSAEVFLFGREGTLRFADGVLTGGRRGDDDLRAIEIRNDDRGAWRVEQDFVNAIWGKKEITLTSFETGVKYMEFTEAAVRSMACGERISLPL